MSEIKPLGQAKHIEEIVKSVENIDSYVKLLYEIYCRITNIEYFTYRASIENIGNVRFIDVIEIDTEPKQVVKEIASDRAVKIYNLSYDDPDILFVNTVNTDYGIPINSGESESFFVREGKALYASFRSTTNKIAVAYLAVWEMKKILPVLLIGAGLLIPAIAFAYSRREDYLKVYVLTNFGKRSVIYDLLPYIISQSEVNGIPPELVLAIIHQESRGNPYAVSSTGAIGLMQIQPETAKNVCGFTKSQLFDPKKNIYCGIKYLKYLKERSDYLKDIIAGYYAGEKAIYYRRRTGKYPSYGKPPVFKYVFDVYNKYKQIRGAVVWKLQRGLKTLVKSSLMF